MAEKLSWTELRRALAERAGVTEKEANAFLNAFSAQMIEALKSDKQVKINGLGSFKLQAIAPRKSVDISTGEEITIEGYNKVVFAPETGVKELVESIPATGASAPQPTEIDPIQKLGAQAEEIVDILGDLGQSPKEEEPKTVIEPTPESIPEPEPEPIPEPKLEPEPEIIVQTPTKKKRRCVFPYILVIILLLLLFFGAYYFFRAQISTWIDRFVAQDTTAVIAEPQEVEQQEVVISEGTISQEQILAEFLQASGELDDLDEVGGQELKYAGLITIEPMHEASRLTWMAKRYYGAKIYWPYLYDANRDRLKDPNMIQTGTPIRVPKLTAAQRDTTNAQTRAILDRLRIQAEAAMK